MERRRFLARLAGAVAALGAIPTALRAEPSAPQWIDTFDEAELLSAVRADVWLCVGGPLDGYAILEHSIQPSGRTNLVAYRLYNESQVRYAWYRLLKHENRAGFYLGYDGPAWGPIDPPQLTPAVTLPR